MQDYKKDSINGNIAYKRLDFDHNAKPTHVIRNDIQTLRAIAIIAVLLFHMWPTTLKFGYLGVDMFFVISGYLIFMLLSKKRPLNLNKIGTFYFRRIKRIVPIYLFIMFISLYAIYQLISPIEFIQIIKESVPALGFYSNMPSTRPAKYFDISSKFFFFLHTWSLSVEMQFYLIVPLFFFILELIDKAKPLFKVIMISSIPVISFLHQCYGSGDTAHMLLSARLWQFCAGFFAHYLYEGKLLDVFKVEENVNDKWRLNLDKLLSATICLLLCLCFVFGNIFDPQISRLLVIVLTTLIVGRSNEHCSILTNKFLVALGDASYSIYLIHWPLFTYQRYANMSYYTAGNEADLITGTYLILASMFIGYLIEKMFKLVLKQIDGWTFLFVFLLAGYYANAMILYQLNRNAINLNEMGPDQLPPDWQKTLRKDVMTLWNERNALPSYTTDKIIEFNSEFIHAFNSLAFCDNKSKKLPTRYPINMSSYDPGTTTVFHSKGNGKKNIVLIGNSHIVHNFPGIQHIFRNVYKRMTLFSRNSCIPASKDFQQPGRSEQVKEECMRLLKETIPALEQWQQPIDIIIAFFALVDMPDFPLPPKNMSDDDFLNSMQTFYSTLGRIPNDALILMENFPLFTDPPISVVSARIKTGERLDTIGDNKTTLMNRFPTLRQRSELINCDKCIKMKFTDYWCGNDTFCHSVQDQGLIYFADWHHPSAFGSFYNAEHMMKRYTDFMAKKG